AFDQPRPRSAESLRSLLSVMQCPVTGEELELDANGTIRTAVSARVWPAIGYRPIMFEGLEPKLFPPEHFSNSLAPQARAIITSTDGLVLNLSAGGSAEWFPNVVEAEAAIFRNTDIVADAHRLPFKNDVFAAVIAMNAFEH